MREITRKAIIGSGNVEHDHVVLSYKSLAKNTQQLVFSGNSQIHLDNHKETMSFFNYL